MLKWRVKFKLFKFLNKLINTYFSLNDFQRIDNKEVNYELTLRLFNEKNNLNIETEEVNKQPLEKVSYEEQLKNAIQNEDFEKAAKLRDIINKQNE